MNKGACPLAIENPKKNKKKIEKTYTELTVFS